MAINLYMILQQKISNQLAFIIIVIFGLIAATVTSVIGSDIIFNFSSGDTNVTSIDRDIDAELLK